MILRRKTKIFSRRDILKLEDRLDIKLSLVNNIKIQIKIETTKKYDKQYLEHPESTRKQIKQMVKNIRAGYYYKDSPNSTEDTHWLKDFSHKDDHLMSKFINYSDRLNYRIYRPEIEVDENGDPLPIQYIKIVLETCKGHSRNGVEKNYSSPT
jgi:hypothetical protein